MIFSRVAMATALVMMAAGAVHGLRDADNERAPRPAGGYLLPANDTGIHDETHGPKGPQGEQGTQGELGPTAIAGEPGVHGPKGDPGTHNWIAPEAGLRGDNGINGTDGAKGDSAANGDDGAKGSKGPKGIDLAGQPGNKGLEGFKGDSGEDGVPGTDNIDSRKGSKGNKGTKGGDGSAGGRGQKGNTGSKGEQGDPSRAGSNGRPGQKGDKGNNAADGRPGRPGTPGLNGRHGAPGDTGRTGAYGDRGSDGGDGLPGNPGANGATGQRGLSGVPGIPGRDGVPGEPGPQGPAGPTGWTVDGDHGDRGAKGDKGNVGLKGQFGPTGPVGYDVLVTAQLDDLHFERLDGQWQTSQAFADQDDATKNGACPDAMDTAHEMLGLADQLHGFQPNTHLAALEYEAVTQTHELMQTAVRATSMIDITARNTIDNIWHLHDALENKLDYYEFPDHYTAHNYPNQGVGASQQTDTITCGGTYTGDTSGATHVVGTASGEHYYTVTVSEGAVYTFSTCGTASYDTYLRLYAGSHLDGTGVEIAEVDDTTGCTGYTQRLTINLTPGEYTLIVEGYSTAEGAYELAVTCSEIPPPFVSEQITCGSTVTGDTTGAEHVVGDPSSEHFYAVTVTEAQNYTFSTCEGTAFDTRLRLFTGSHLEASSIEIANSDDTCGHQSHIEMMLAPGSYTVLVEGYNTDVGAYTLAVACEPTGSAYGSGSESDSGSGE